MAAVTHGSAMIIIEQFNPERVLQAVQDEKCTALHGVPTMFIATNHPNFKEYDTPHYVQELWQVQHVRLKSCAA